MPVEVAYFEARHEMMTVDRFLDGLLSGGGGPVDGNIGATGTASAANGDGVGGSAGAGGSVGAGADSCDGDIGGARDGSGDGGTDGVGTHARFYSYIAQHTMLDQMPHLARHLPVPDLCHCMGSDLNRHFFFGPKGTLTPVHHDPYHNCFVQVVGSKYVRLYSPQQGDLLTAARGACPPKGMDGKRDAKEKSAELSNNIAPSESLPPDLLTAPPGSLYHTLPYQEAVVGPGDLLFIPVRWWHFVKSLGVSISVAHHITPD